MTRGTRKLHTWVGLIAGIPFLTMIVTALSIIHGNKLGLNRIQVNASWLPGYAEVGARRAAVTAVIDAPDGQFIGTRGGLYHSGATVEFVRRLGKAEIRNLIALEDGKVLAVTSTGLWHNRSGEWRPMLKGNVMSANIQSSGRIAALTQGRGILTSDDGGRTWLPGKVAKLPAAAAHAGPISLKTLVADIHTGNALFGSRRRWIWTDLVALSFATMVLSGVWGWYRTKRSRARALEFAAQKAKASATPAGAR